MAPSSGASNSNKSPVRGAGGFRGAKGTEKSKGANGRSDKGAASAAAAAAPSVPPPLGDEFAVPVRELVKPDNQLSLTEAELAEELPRMLTAINPMAPKNLARFNTKERCFKFEAMVDQTAVHYACDGRLLHKGSDEARRQAEAERAEADAAARRAAEAARERDGSGGEGATTTADAGAGADAAPDDGRALRNQFNFGERAAQTFGHAPRDRGVMTEPPATAAASGSCSAWELYDDYARDAERARAEEAAKPKGGGRKGGGGGATAAANAAAAAGTGGGGGQAAAALAPLSSSGKAAEGMGTLQGQATQQQAALKATSAAAAAAAAAAPEALLAAAGPGLERALRVLDRMAAQNAAADVAMDFKYWDDAADALRPGEGSLLPLWTFRCPRGRKHVTSIAWSRGHSDMFAVGYGSYHFHRQTGGLVAIHTLKNPAAPECLFATPSCVMAVDLHPTRPNLIAVGCHDGSVAVFDARARGGPPLCHATARGGKHADAVWQVAWQEDEAQRALQFASVSGDGDVLLWTLAHSELRPERLMRLTAPPGGGCAAAADAAAAAAAAGGYGQDQTLSADASLLASRAGATASSADGSGSGGSGGARRVVVGGASFDFNKAPGHEDEYLVGTEDGGVVLCSKAYSSEVLAAWPAHAMAAYSVRWGPLHPGVFLTASADWTVRVWDARGGRRRAARAGGGAPALSFDLGDAVGDAAWAPYSATVFAAATDDGRVHVFDLAVSRLGPLCSQKIVKSGRLTKLAFNRKHPVLLVGDSKGNVTCLKLSPNLRRNSASAATGGAAAGAGAGAAGAGASVAAAAAAAGAASAAPGSPARAKFEAAERARLDAVLDVAAMARAAAAAGGV